MKSFSRLHDNYQCSVATDHWFCGRAEAPRNVFRYRWRLSIATRPMLPERL
jgi:hypothetical protein